MGGGPGPWGSTGPRGTGQGQGLCRPRVFLLPRRRAPHRRPQRAPLSDGWGQRPPWSRAGTCLCCSRVPIHEAGLPDRAPDIGRDRVFSGSFQCARLAQLGVGTALAASLPWVCAPQVQGGSPRRFGGGLALSSELACGGQRGTSPGEGQRVPRGPEAHGQRLRLGRAWRCPHLLAAPGAAGSEAPCPRPHTAARPLPHLCKHPPAGQENGPFVPGLAPVPQASPSAAAPASATVGPGLAIVPAGPWAARAPDTRAGGKQLPFIAAAAPAAVRVPPAA